MAIMANMAVERIRLELKELIESEEITQCGIKVELTDDSFYELTGEIMGPPDTPYEGGKFKLEIKIPIEYPFEPPKIRFVTKIWHANISAATGFIGLDLLKDLWSASLTLRTVLLSLQVLLSVPEPDYPQDAVVAGQFKHNPKMFKLTACHWTNVYAGGPSKVESFDDKVKKMMELDLAENDSRAALSSCNWDLQNAINQFFPIDNHDVNSHQEDYLNEYYLSEYYLIEDDQNEDDID